MITGVPRRRSVKIRGETITHYLGGHAKLIIDRKRSAMPPGCPLLAAAAA